MEPASRFFDQQDWLATTSGAGTVVFSEGGKVVNCDAVAGDRAFLQYFTAGWPGDSFEFSVIARNIDTGKSGWAEVFVDSPTTRRDEARVTTIEPETITIRYDVPLAASSIRVVAFGIGVDSPTDGSAEFMLPRIRRLDDRIFLRGTFKAAAGGGMVVHPTLPSFNVNDASIIWDATNLEMVVTPRETTTFLVSGKSFKPAVYATGGPDNSGADPVIWNVGKVLSDGTFSIQALDANSGARLDLSAGTGSDLFVNVKMEL